MRAGKLRHRITIQQTTQTRTTSGDVSDSWSTSATLWASVEPLHVGSREFFDAAKLNAQVTHQIRIRYRSGVTPMMRISWDSRIFEILYVYNVEERDREMVLLAREMIE